MSSQPFHVVDWLPPDFGAVGQYGAIFARDLAVGGRDVRLIGLATGDDSTTREVLANEKIFRETRIHASAYTKGSFISRLLWTFGLTSALFWKYSKTPDRPEQRSFLRAHRGRREGFLTSSVPMSRTR
jgi:hypothetical protein